jgi:hypothetical protein
MVGLASVNDQFSGGMDDSFNSSQMSLPIGGLWNVENWLFTGNCVRGRATQVARISKTLSIQAVAAIVLPLRSAERHVAKASGSKQKGTQGGKVDSEPTASAETIERLQRHPEAKTLTCHDMLDIPLDDLPSNLIIKDSWPLVDRNIGNAMYGAAQGLFGVPVVLASYEVRGPDKTPNTTERFLPADITPLIVWQSQPADPRPEKRVHMRHLYKTIGRDLPSASSPRELLEGILHAMIGVLPVSNRTFESLTLTMMFKVI